ncbi:MAG: protein-L-isoaspartate(D-aspartate) O-methyltransferase [Gammaproteobacteria bacterium]|nr:protein-L-isoaspartate(D-aspartate) O-methyltransferase [Gammaproteobacteria bacterium]NIR85805.1 protein-L-isoaspartate(D-aspartate) O-methyltransferase [Gammaproteobacteria bacterium]NIR90559.1 protein-L-isoaspartate(D-aspartate) O-methyltransferase [Gammaproteobacteria bacterium]NIU06940.1 protein-L-isoaspartate(D-aspartate) O-methyltransferase [Gammaproteobacteria bacterium]NIV53870.1 protein-L-isoaspartate(D-aspartate) O-methyltransferase [Gammaproteobacteria bacterium]
MTDTDTNYEAQRKQMVDQISLHADFVSKETKKATLAPKVLDAIRSVPRHEYVPVELRSFAYLDTPLPIGYGKTISQPFIVALMTDLLEPQPGDCVLEVGTGLGYQSAILAGLVRQVYTVEIVEELARDAERRLRGHGYANIEFAIGDGSGGWPQHAPFEKIVVTAAPELIPAALLNQLKPQGRMVIPAGIESAQQLMLVTKDSQGRTTVTEILPVRFSTLATEP